MTVAEDQLTAQQKALLQFHRELMAARDRYASLSRGDRQHFRQHLQLVRSGTNWTLRHSTDGTNWTDISAGLPSDFGYAIACDPRDPDTVFQVPLSSTQLRAPPEGKPVIRN